MRVKHLYESSGVGQRKHTIKARGTRATWTAAWRKSCDPDWYARPSCHRWRRVKNVSRLEVLTPCENRSPLLNKPHPTVQRHQGDYTADAARRTITEALELTAVFDAADPPADDTSTAGEKE